MNLARRGVWAGGGQFDRTLWVLVLSQLITSVGFSLALPFLSLYLHRDRGMAMTVVGAIALTNGVVSALGRVVGGALSDRVGCRITVLGAVGWRVLLFLALAALIARDGPLWAIVLVYLAVRITGALAMSAVTAMVGDMAGANRRMEAYALLRVGGNVGWATGPALGGFMASFLPYWTMFSATAALTAGAFVLLLRHTQESTGQRESFNPLGLRDVFLDRRFLALAGISLLVFVVAGQLVSTLSVFTVSRLGFSEGQFGGLLTLNGLLVVAFQYPLTRVLNRFPPRRLLAVGSLLYGLGYLVVGLAQAYGPLVGAMVVVTCGEMVFSPAALTTTAALAPRGQRGRYLGVFGWAETFGWSLGGFVGGVLLDLFPEFPLGTWGPVGALGLVAAGAFSVWDRPRLGADESVNGPFQGHPARSLHQEQGGG